jgi:hypothetical protein
VIQTPRATADARPSVAEPAPSFAAPTSTAPGGTDVLSKVIDAVNRVHRSTGSLLSQHGVFARFESDTVTIGIKPTVKMFFDKQDRRAYIDKAIKATFGADARAQLTFDNPPAAPAAPAAAAPTPVTTPPVTAAPVSPAPASSPVAAPPAPPVPAAAPISSETPAAAPASFAAADAPPATERSIPQASAVSAPLVSEPAAPEPVFPETPEPAAFTSEAPASENLGAPLDIEVPDREPPTDEDWSEPVTETTEDLTLGVPLTPVMMEGPALRPASDDVIGKAAEIFSGRVIDPID